MQNTAYLLSVLKWERKSIRWRDFLKEGRGGEGAELNLDWWHKQKRQLCAQVQSCDKVFLFPNVYLPNLLRAFNGSINILATSWWQKTMENSAHHGWTARIPVVQFKVLQKNQEILLRLEVNLLPCSAPTGTTRCGTSPTCWSTLTGRFSGFRRRFIRFCSSIRRLNGISYLPVGKYNQLPST